MDFVNNKFLYYYMIYLCDKFKMGVNFKFIINYIEVIG